MAKNKTTVFYCQNCGYESSKWMGQCPGCKEWNTMVEEKAPAKSGAGGGAHRRESVIPTSLTAVDIQEEERMSTHMAELDRVLGGGIVPGSLTLVGGDPGIGKSTLLLQVCRYMAADGRKVLYISGEESLRQIKIRANRIGSFSDNLLLLCETSLETVEQTIRSQMPAITIIDSIQTMYHEEISSAPGSVSQVRESTNVLLQLAKGLNISVFIVGHVTKEGTVAGPRVLEHMVDTVLYRFGSTNEIGVFEMKEEGLVEVRNASEFMLSGKPEGASGSVVSCSMEGTRPILLEIQALVCHSNFGIPRRQATGMDFNRLNLLMAVLEKRLGLQMSDCDAYVNLAGGMRIMEPAIDLGVSMAVVSSFKNRVIDDKTIAFGEIGLSGEVRGVSMAAQRVSEAAKLGFTTCILPEVNISQVRKTEGIRLIGVKSVRDAIDLL